MSKLEEIGALHIAKRVISSHGVTVESVRVTRAYDYNSERQALYLDLCMTESAIADLRDRKIGAQIISDLIRDFDDVGEPVIISYKECSR